MLDYSYIKPKYRQVEDAESLGPQWGSVVFHRAPIVKIRLTWPQRWMAFAALFDPRDAWANLRFDRGRYISAFWTGWSYQVRLDKTDPTKLEC